MDMLHRPLSSRPSVLLGPLVQPGLGPYWLLSFSLAGVSSGLTCARRTEAVSLRTCLDFDLLHPQWTQLFVPSPREADGRPAVANVAICL